MLEYLRGGQLYDSLHRLAGSEEPYTEQAAAAVFAQVSAEIWVRCLQAYVGCLCWQCICFAKLTVDHRRKHQPAALRVNT